MMPIVLALDCGTQSIRAMLFDADGNLVDKVKETYEPYFSVKEGYCEQYVELYWEKLCSATRRLKANNRGLWAAVKAVTVTTMRDVGICVDKEMKPLRPAVLWLDRREADVNYDSLPLKSRLAFGVAGMKETVEKTVAECKCLWIQQNEPEIWKNTYKYLQYSTYLTYRLCGETVDSVASMIGHIPFDYKHKRWMGEKHIQKPCFRDFPSDKLFPLVEPGTVMGKITAECAHETGIPEGLPLIASGSDKGCETLGTGAVYRDTAAISFGTTATIQLTTRKYVEPERFLPAYPAVYPEMYNPETIVYRGYWMLTWFVNEFVKRAGGSTNAEHDFDKKLPAVPPGCEGLIVEPYWSPSLKRTEACGAMLGFTEKHTIYHIYRAIIEGVNFALIEGLKGMEKRAHARVMKLTVSGGGAQSDEVCQIAADMFGLPVQRVQTYETSGLGAAICAFVGLGVYSDYDEAIRKMVKVTRVFKPDRNNHAKYAVLYRKVYEPIYRRIKPVNKTIKKLKKGDIYV